MPQQNFNAPSSNLHKLQHQLQPTTYKKQIATTTFKNHAFTHNV
jgi:hypothetical protein